MEIQYNEKTSVSDLKVFLKDIGKHQTSIKKLIKQKEKLKKAKTVTCSACDHRNTFNKTKYIRAYWYEEPWGCTGGDNWNFDESDSGFVCCKCNTKNRLLPQELHYKKWGSVEEEYPTRSNGSKYEWVNYKR